MALSQEDQVLIQSYATLELLHALDQNKFFESDYFKSLEFEDQFAKRTLSAIGMGNRGMLLISLYTLLVIPKQLLEDTYPDEFEKLNEFVGETKVSSSGTYFKTPKDRTDFMRHIRNAVAHSRVEFVTRESVVFKDRGKNGYCSIILPLDTFGKFVGALQSVFYRHVSELRRK